MKSIKVFFLKHLIDNAKFFLSILIILILNVNQTF
jgi:hypothetical protein